MSNGHRPSAFRTQGPIATHRAAVRVLTNIPAVIEAAAEITLRVKATCLAGCDLRGFPLNIASDEGTIRATTLGIGGETDDLRVTLPHRVGDQAWSVVLEGHEKDGVVHEASPATIIFRTVPHRTSVAVWDVASPVVIGQLGVAKVGVRCSASCCLAGEPVEIHDASGRCAGRGVLGQTPWPGTVALYVAEITVLGPSDPGVFSYTAQFDAASLAIAHSSAEAPFSVVAALPPEHTITVRVSDRFTGDPIEDVSVRCAVYRAVTNSDGVAVLRVPSGAYELCASKPSYEDIPPRTVDVTGDLVINVQSAPTHDTNPDDERMWM